MNRKDTVAPRGEIKAFLGEGTDFKGILTFEGTVRIDGQMEGEIFTKDTLIVGESAVNLPLVVDGQMTEVSSVTIGPLEVVSP